MVKSIPSLLLIMLVCSVTLAQSQSDTAFVVAAAKVTQLTYTQAIKSQLQLYNGSDYQDYVALKEEHPYFINDDWTEGSVTYNGEHYENVSLLYNIHTDNVIVENPYGGRMIQLISGKVQSFVLNEHQFVRLTDSTLTTGFYDLLVDGRNKLYARRTKEFQEIISSSELIHEFREKSKYMIRKNDVYYSVRSKRSVINLFSDRKRELNQFVRKNHIRFNDNREKAIVALTEFYNGN